MNLGSQTANRQEKVRKLARAAESFLALAGIKDFTAPRLPEVVAEWDAEVWTRLSMIARVSTCANAAKNERVCSECLRLVIEDFRERATLAADLRGTVRA